MIVRGAYADVACARPNPSTTCRCFVRTRLFTCPRAYTQARGRSSSRRQSRKARARTCQNRTSRRTSSTVRPVGNRRSLGLRAILVVSSNEPTEPSGSVSSERPVSHRHSSLYSTRRLPPQPHLLACRVRRLPRPFQSPHRVPGVCVCV